MSSVDRNENDILETVEGTETATFMLNERRVRNISMPTAYVSSGMPKFIGLFVEVAGAR